MIETFRLHQLLRETVQSPYRCLVTRPTGAAIRNRIERSLEASPCVTALLDFAEVEMLDFSCADEVVAKLLLARGPGERPYFVLSGLHDGQREAVEHVLRHHQLAVAALREPARSPSVLGCADEDARLAFESVCSEGPADDRTLASRLGWAPERAARAIEGLAWLRLAQVNQGTLHPVPLP